MNLPIAMTALFLSKWQLVLPTLVSRTSKFRVPLLISHWSLLICLAYQAIYQCYFQENQQFQKDYSLKRFIQYFTYKVSIPFLISKLFLCYFFTVFSTNTEASENHQSIYIFLIHPTILKHPISGFD